MKRILLAIFMLLAVCLTFASCKEDEIGGFKYDDYVPEVKEELAYNLYIICGDETSENAKVTVSRRIAQYTKDKYKTTVNVIYKSAAEYEESVKGAVKPDPTSEVKRADIVLITNESLMNYFMQDQKLADLTALYNTEDFGRLNKQITKSLLDASMIDGKLYTVPNNRVLGTYDYLVFDRAMAKALFYGTDAISALTDYDAAIADFQAKLDAKFGEGVKNAADYIELLTAQKYEKRFELSTEKAESGELKYYYNIVKTPEVTATDAFTSAFAVAADVKDVFRAMEIIYGINTDMELRNLLQYGVKDTNYYVADETDEGIPEGYFIPKVESENGCYVMNIIHTGDVFKAAYSCYYGWTEADAKNGALQNAESKAQEIPQP